MSLTLALVSWMPHLADDVQHSHECNKAKAHEDHYKLQPAQDLRLTACEKHVLGLICRCSSYPDAPSGLSLDKQLRAEQIAMFL